MFKHLSLAAAALTMTAGALVPATAAEAQGYGRYDRGYDQYQGRGYNDRYERRQYRQDRRAYRNRGGRCRSGDTGTILGAVAGGLLGRTIDTRGNRLLGTVLGAGGGALAGRAIERSSDCGGRRYR